MTATKPMQAAAEPSLPIVEETLESNRPYVLQTPIHDWDGPELRERLGVPTDVVLKLELFQYTGSFKARAAITGLRVLDSAARARGVVAVSAGNHAIATAYAAQVLGSSAKVVMPASGSPARIARARAYGAEVVFAPTGPAAFELVRTIESDEGRSFIHPFEGPNVAIGTATLGVEFHRQAATLDAIVVPIGGGGLCAGVSWAIKTMQPDCRVYGVEPSGADTMFRSFAAGKPVSRDDIATIADSLAPPYALPYSFALCRRYVDRLVRVEDEQMLDAMAVLFREMKLAVEPAGAAATAALLGPLREELAGKRVGIVVCGTNIDIETFGAYVARGQALSSRR